MIARRILLAVVLVTPAALLFAQDRPRADDRSGAKPAAATHSIDGTWTVVSCSKTGKAVDGADKMTVTIKDNVATFSGGSGADKTNGMKAVRLEFQPGGMLRATEAGADGRFAATGTTDRSGTGGGSTGTMTGVYVLTPDYFAVCINNPTATTGTGTGGTTDRDRPTDGKTGSPHMDSHMSVVLKRSGGADRR